MKMVEIQITTGLLQNMALKEEREVALLTFWKRHFQEMAAKERRVRSPRRTGDIYMVVVEDRRS